MDNLTHSLIGLIAGETLAGRARRRSGEEAGLTPETRRGLFVTLSVIGNNLPDLDLLYSYRPLAHDRQAAELDYLLQHRGYTHTLLGCLVLALLLYGVVELWARWRRQPLAPRDRWALFGVSLSGTLLHLGMDYLNSYGVHPFWPWRDDWFYGDSIFIVEPLYWVAAVPLFFVVRAWWARAVLVVAPVAAAMLASASHMASTAWSIGYLVLAAVMLFVGSRVTARSNIRVSACATVAVTIMFVLAGKVAANMMRYDGAVNFMEYAPVDRILTPAPMNPLCWDVWVLAADKRHYFASRGKLSLAPAWIAPAQCPGNVAERESRPDLFTNTVQWAREDGVSREALRNLVATHCDIAAFMQFARAPFLRDETIVDLRFEREGGSGMGSFVPGPPDKAPCRKMVPWKPPRAELLDPTWASFSGF
jgi:inner membrane protein